MTRALAGGPPEQPSGSLPYTWGLLLKMSAESFPLLKRGLADYQLRSFLSLFLQIRVRRS